MARFVTLLSEKSNQHISSYLAHLMLPLVYMASCQIVCLISMHRKEMAIVWLIGFVGIQQWFDLNQRLPQHLDSSSELSLRWRSFYKLGENFRVSSENPNFQKFPNFLSSFAPKPGLIFHLLAFLIKRWLAKRKLLSREIGLISERERRLTLTPCGLSSIAIEIWSNN